MEKAKTKIKKNDVGEAKKQSVLEQLWLTYYNDTLYDKGIISEDARNRMRVQIKQRTASR